MEKIKEFNILHIIKRYYGLCTLAIVELCAIVALIIWGDYIYLAVNDCLDSNLALYKMYKDYSLWTDLSSSIPFLGGLDRSILNPGYTISMISYFLFDTQTAFWINYLVAILLSGVGFFCLGSSIGKLTERQIINPNVFCILGIIFIMSGIWPIAIIPFSLIPWWAFLTVEAYRTKKIWIAAFFVILTLNISGPLMAVFLLFYTAVFYLILFVKDKESRKCIVCIFIIILACFLLCNGYVLISVFSTQKNNIKSLATSGGYIYVNSVGDCVKKFLKNLVLLDNIQYHSGIWSLRYVALPLAWIFFFLFNVEKKNLGVSRQFSLVYNLIMCAISLNALAAAFDKCAFIRQFIPFLSGFGFERFVWLSPFFIIFAFAMILQYLEEKHFNYTAIVLVLSVALMIVVDPQTKGTSSDFNVLHNNFVAYVLNGRNGIQARWDEYYNQKLFETITEEIEYDGEWSVAYGLEPCILQYNQIRTLDGYYSNYPIEYKEKWEEMIAPVLEINSYAQYYWNISNGQRAYIYGICWTNPDYYIDYDNVTDKRMLINVDILNQLGAKYVFSRVEIENYSELGFRYLGTWKDDKEFYKISVYEVENQNG